MNTSLLARLDAAPEDVATLSRTDARSVVQFLLRWEAFTDALACLALLEIEALVTWQDLQVQALMGAGQMAEAVRVMEERIATKDSATAQLLLARCYLAHGAHDHARELLRTLTERDYSGTAWGLTGELALANGDLQGAERAYLRYQQLAPTSGRAALGLSRLYQQRGDVVTAAAYAVRAYGDPEDAVVLPVELLTELRRSFAAAGDENRLRDVTNALVRRFDQEAEQMRLLLQSGSARSAAKAQANAAAPIVQVAEVSKLDDIVVSSQEAADLQQAALQLFGFSTLLSAQPQIMASARRGEDILAVLPTGAGKSLCYQLPAFLDGGVTLVISPLIALMKDQVDSLPPTLRQHTIAINSSLDGRELTQALEGIISGRYRLVYAAPERLRQWSFIDMLRRAGLTRLVIDEAHCVSVWGHDFRPDYLHIAQAHRDLGAPPILALTATAPQRVRQDIEQQLFGRMPDAERRRLRTIVADTYRANLHFSAVKVRDDDERRQQVITLCRALQGSGIVYARSRAKCEEVAALLRSQGVDALHYHAGSENRSEIQDRFMENKVRVIVATVAFGMGVDKSDIRFIIHFGLPNSVEAYYQEAGRAGRDGKEAHCILLYNSGDRSTLTLLANQSKVGVELLRKVYAGVRQRLGVHNPGTVALDGLAAALEMDETTVRVGLSILEEAGLLRRHYDAPRAVAVRLTDDRRDAALHQFAQALKMQRGQMAEGAYLDVAAATGIAPTELEARLLQWQADGGISVRTNGREALVTILSAPTNATARIEGLIDRYDAIQEQRVTEIFAYARTRHCRHGHLAGYLGGQARTRCANCDNCGVQSLPNLHSSLPDEQKQRAVVLSALNEQSWGRRNLVRLLRGDAEIGERGQRSSQFGKLNFRSDSALERLVLSLVQEGLIEEVVLPKGFIALQLTQQGRMQLGKR